MLCHFDYSISLCYFGLSKALKNKLQVARNKAIRFNLGLKSRSPIGFSEFRKLGLLNVKYRAFQLSLNHIYNIFHENCPVYMKELFTKLSNVHGYNTRGSQLNFHVPKVKFVSSTTFFFNGIKQWNILPSIMKEIFIKSTFKHVAKNTYSRV